jgi:hypothetical protein
MQEHQVTIGKETFAVPEPFLVLATQNPIESDGTYRSAANASQLEQVYAQRGSQINWVQEQTEVTAIASGLGAALLTIAGLLGLGWFGRLP